MTIPPEASRLAAAIRQDTHLGATLIEGGGGVFDVTIDGELVFSKRRVHRFPEAREIVAAIRARQAAR